MIGGAMLLCSVMGISLICYWALKNDDLPEGAPREGLFAMRQWGERTVVRKTQATRRRTGSKPRKASSEPAKRRTTAKPPRKRNRRPARQMKHLLDDDELLAVEDEIEAAERRIGPRNRSRR